MTTSRTAFAALAGLLVLFLAGTEPARAQQAAPESLRRLALVIGNSNYTTAPLKNPSNDARAVAKVLKDLGFDVTHRENANQKAMAEVIRQFGARLTPGTAAVFYFAGHGIQVRGRNYLVPVDADVQVEDEVPYSAIDVGLVLDKMESAKSAVNVVILDACRNNPFARRFRASNAGLAQMDAPIGTLLAYATAPGSVAQDGSGENGVFTKHLLANITTPGLAVEQMFKRVRVAVAKDTREMQVPWESSSLKGEFAFREAPRQTQASQDQLIEQAARQAAERAATMTAERIAREQAARPAAPAADTQGRMESDRLAAEREKLRQERERLEEDKAALRKEIAQTKTRPAKTAPSAPSKTVAAAPAAAVRPPPAQPAAVAATSGGARPEPGDTWTYRVTTRYGKTTTYSARAVAAGTGKMEDELRAQKQRRPQVSGSVPVMLSVLGQQDGVDIREVSPYLQLLGGAEPGTTWRDIALLPDSDDFSGRVVGHEQVTVPAGTFDAIKIVLEGSQPVAGTGPRRFSVIVWYAAAAKRFVRAVYSAPEANQSYFIYAVAERDVVELMETSFPMAGITGGGGPRMAAAAAPAKNAARKSPHPQPVAGDTWTYRIKTLLGKTASYTVRTLGITEDGVQDEIRAEDQRQTQESGAEPVMLSVLGQQGSVDIREVSPYLQALGGAEPGTTWRGVALLPNSDDFAGRVVGREQVTVPAGSFDAVKIVLEGSQPVAGTGPRRFSVTVWYAAAAKRFVKAVFSAPEANQSYFIYAGAERDTVELIEYRPH